MDLKLSITSSQLCIVVYKLYLFNAVTYKSVRNTFTKASGLVLFMTALCTIVCTCTEYHAKESVVKLCRHGLDKLM